MAPRGPGGPGNCLATLTSCCHWTAAAEEDGEEVHDDEEDEDDGDGGDDDEDDLHESPQGPQCQPLLQY